MTCDGAEWIHTVVAEHAPDAIVCLDTFHVIGWATTALDEVRRGEWNQLRRNGGHAKAKSVKGLRWILLRNWENLTLEQKHVIRDLQRANGRLVRGWSLKEELRDILSMRPNKAKAALDAWLACASRSRLAPFVKLARTIRRYRTEIEATSKWRLTNGLAESNNAAIGRLRTNARGFHHPDAFITMIMLDRAGLTPNSHGNKPHDPRNDHKTRISVDDGQDAPVRSHLTNMGLTRCRQRIQQATFGHRGWNGDPLYNVRKLFLLGAEHVDEVC